MTTETESLHLTQSSSLSSLPTPQPLDHLRSNDSSTQDLQNEGMNNEGFQIPSPDDFCSCILFNITQLKNILLSCFNLYESDNIAREANEEFIKPQATTDSNAQPQHRSSDFYETWSDNVYQSIPCGEQIQKDVTSNLVVGPQSLSSTSPPRQTDGVFDAWNGPQGNNDQEYQTDYTIEGSAYMISRKPFDPIGRPFNPFGPIERPIPRLPSSYELADLGFV